MNIVYFGTADFAVPCLETLAAGRHTVKLCVSQPDRPKGRGRTTQPSPVKQCALKNNIPVFQPVSLEDASALKTLSEPQADIFVIVAYGVKLTPEVLRAPGKVCMNVHASLLPRYRGAAPIQWALANGEHETGISFIRMTESIDTGPVLFQKKVSIGKHETAVELARRLSVLAAGSLEAFLTQCEAGRLTETAQEDRLATRAPRLSKAHGEIRWSRRAVEVDRQVRAMQPWPLTVTSWSGKQVKILRGRYEAARADGAPGTVLSVGPEGIRVACGEGRYLIEELKLESSRAMSASAFLAGHNMSPGTLLGQ